MHSSDKVHTRKTKAGPTKAMAKARQRTPPAVNASQRRAAAEAKQHAAVKAQQCAKAVPMEAKKRTHVPVKSTQRAKVMTVKASHLCSRVSLVPLSAQPLPAHRDIHIAAADKPHRRSIVIAAADIYIAAASS